MEFFKRNPFGHILFLKKWLIRILGAYSHRRYRGFNELKIEGSEIIRNLQDSNVLFISNHQTYFADVVAMFHVFNASLKGRVDSIKNIGYLWNPKLNIYFIAAKETMNAGLIPKMLAYAGSVSIERTWRSNGEDVNRKVKFSDISNIGKALNDGGVITFPQGTTTPFKPVRKGRHKPPPAGQAAESCTKKSIETPMGCKNHGAGTGLGLEPHRRRPSCHRHLDTVAGGAGERTPA